MQYNAADTRDQATVQVGDTQRREFRDGRKGAAGRSTQRRSWWEGNRAKQTKHNMNGGKQEGWG
jgi:hypothetical protein